MNNTLKILFVAMTWGTLVTSCCTPSAVIGSVNGPLRPQETNNWCWAGVTEMIAEHEGLSVNQCDLANHRFGKTNCCDYQNDGQPCPKTSDCNRPGWPELDYVGLNFTAIDNALSWSSLRKSIYCNKDVLGFGYGTPGVVGHVVTIKGYLEVSGTKYVVINDPWAPCEGQERLITYEEYQDPAGTSTHWKTWYKISKK
ncbi:MAG: hypothetical protein WBG71_04065 [Leeuwenhoekiella sp.]